MHPLHTLAMITAERQSREADPARRIRRTESPRRPRRRVVGRDVTP